MKQFFTLLFTLAFIPVVSYGQLTVTIDTLDTGSFPLVRMKVRVLDGGSSVRGLGVPNFTVFEQGVLQVPLAGYCDDTVQSGPVSVLLVIDKSGSMGWPFSDAITDAKRAASNFVDRLSSLDEAALLTFSDQSSLDQNWTNDKALLKSRINAIQTGGGTLLWDAIVRAVNLIAPRTKKKVIIVLTDGRDTGSINPFSIALNAVQSSSILVYTIGLGVNIDTPSLTQIATATGGKYYYAPTGSDLDQIYASISQQISSTGICELRYTSKEDCLDGSSRAVNVVVASGGRTAQTTVSYKLPYDSTTFTYLDLELDRKLVMEYSSRATFPIRITRVSTNRSIRSIQFALEFDTKRLSLVSAEATRLSNGYTTTIQQTPTGAVLSMQGTTAIADTGALVLVTFEAGETYYTTPVPVHITSPGVQTTCTVAAATDGLITVSGSCERAIVRRSGTPQRKTELLPNVPNPFNPGTTLRYTLSAQGNVTLVLSDALGRELSKLHAGELTPGEYSLYLDGTFLSAGSYIVTLATPAGVYTQRILLVK